MSKMIKRLMVVLVAVLMVFSSAMTAVEAKGSRGGKRQPTETTVEPSPEVAEDTEAAPEEEILETEETELVAAEETVGEDVIVEPVFNNDPVPFAWGGTVSPLAEGDPTVTTDNPLNLTKTVTPNGDGTYKISLSITGAVEQSTHTEVSSANVIVVLDVSSSMTQSFGTGTRLDAVKTAANLLVDAMPNEAAVEMALIAFGGSVSTPQTWLTIDSDTNKSTFKSKVTALTTNQGTNWGDALAEARAMADAKKNAGDTDPIYIVFLTDGCPTSMKTGHSHGSGGTTNINDACISDALSEMTQSVNSGYQVYGVYANTTSTATMPRDGQNGAYTGDSDPLRYIIRVSGAAGYFNATSTDELNDVFTELAKTITDSLGYNNAAIDDGITNLSNTSASTTVSGEASGFEYTKDGAAWTGAPEAKLDNGSVVWDLSELGNLEDGVTYTVTFDVWPSQAAYDLVADLNNGIKAYDDLTADEKAQIGGEGPNGYYLLTNTHLNNTYTHSGTDYVYNGDKGNSGMALAAETINLKKLWPENMLDRYGAATYRDEEGNEKTATEINLTVTKDGTDYLDVTVDSEHGWEKDNIYISCGLMTIKNGVVDIKEPGYDYTVTEPSSFSYYWDLYADVYHPMVINGETIMLILDEDATSADNTNTFEINGKFYTKSPAEANTLEASNYRRSNLNLTKVVSTEGGYDGYFTYTVTVTDTNSSDGNVWFSAWDPETGATVKDTDWVTGATAEEGNTGYWYAANGSTLTLKIKAGWNVRFLNLYHGSTFSFEETDMPEHYTFEKVEAATQFDFMDDDSADWYETTEKKVEGTIVEPNNSYTVTYTNKYEAFYIYHSGVAEDGNLQIVGMDEVKEDGTYDLYATTTKGTLYGGYYLDYAGKGDYKDDGVAGTTGVAYTGMNYDWSGAQTVSGTAIKPVAGETYYIKEVPTYYLRNYYQINYIKTNSTNVAARGDLKSLYLISAVDDLNYNETGIIIQTADQQKSKVASSFTFKNFATGKSVKLTANTVFKSLGITEAGEYLTYFNATNTKYFAVGNFTVLPYWITPDGITVNGISTRTIKITEMKKSGISKTDN